jgi:hypothetical protein
LELAETEETKAMAPTAIQPNEAKLKELIVYVAAKCQDDKKFGAVKLNKILYMADMFAYAELGYPITGVEYMKQKAGPVPRRLLPIKRDMEEAGDIVEVERPYYGMAHPQKRVVPLRKADLTLFTADEIAHVDAILDDCKDASGGDLSDYTHMHLGWIIAREMGDAIPYPAVFLSEAPVTAYERERAEQLIPEHGWDVR